MNRALRKLVRGGLVTLPAVLWVFAAAAAPDTLQPVKMIGKEPSDALGSTNLVAVTMHTPPATPQVDRGDIRMPMGARTPGADWMQLARGLTENMSPGAAASSWAPPVTQTARLKGPSDEMDAPDRDTDAALVPLDGLLEFESSARQGWGWLATSVDRLEAREIREREDREMLDAAGLYGETESPDRDPWVSWEDRVTPALYGTRAFDPGASHDRADDWSRLLSPSSGGSALGGDPYSDVENDFALPAFGAADNGR
jgi:hypothetical protein